MAKSSVRVIASLSLASSVILTGCQVMHAKPQPSVTKVPTTNTPTAVTPVSSAIPVTPPPKTQPTQATTPQQFTINGKIGLTTPQQAGSAFYVWSQNGSAFGIELSGALNAGQTNISYNGQTATLTNDKGTISATSPEELLYRATGWQAPISQLPYWIMGQTAPSDSNDKHDAKNRLITAYNSDWLADFSYATDRDDLPNRITMRHPDGYKVVLTINRLS